MKISVKSSSVEKTVEAYKLLSSKVDYPLHVGVTEAGTLLKGSVKSAIGIGLILSEGIGDTIRVSLTGDPEPEAAAGIEILRALELRGGVNVISCPTCGRTCIDVAGIMGRVQKELAGVNIPFKVAVMGCVVNGPGEAREADIGMAGGKNGGMLFRKGQAPETVRGNLEEIFLHEVLKLCGEEK